MIKDVEGEAIIWQGGPSKAFEEPSLTGLLKSAKRAISGEAKVVYAITRTRALVLLVDREGQQIVDQCDLSKSFGSVLNRLGRIGPSSFGRAMRGYRGGEDVGDVVFFQGGKVAAKFVFVDKPDDVLSFARGAVASEATAPATGPAVNVVATTGSVPEAEQIIWKHGPTYRNGPFVTGWRSEDRKKLFYVVTRKRALIVYADKVKADLVGNLPSLEGDAVVSQCVLLGSQLVVTDRGQGSVRDQQHSQFSSKAYRPTEVGAINFMREGTVVMSFKYVPNPDEAVTTIKTGLAATF